jgi:serine O-acetyltransferase
MVAQNMNQPARPGSGHALREIGWIRDDFAHIRNRDPALRGKPLAWLEVLTYPGLWAIASHRIAHAFHRAGLPLLPRVLSQLARFLTGVEIHPGAQIGRGLFIDHASGVVIGETAEIGEHVLMFHQVTLGNADVDSAGKRHPTIGSGVVLGAGAMVLGPITVGDFSVIGAGTVVTRSVPTHSLVVGCAGRVVRTLNQTAPADPDYDCGCRFATGVDGMVANQVPAGCC